MMTAENDVCLGTVKKSREKNVRVTVADYGGKPYIYLQIVPANETSPSVAGNYPGITLTPDNARVLMPLLNDAVNLAETREYEEVMFRRMPEGGRRRR